METRNTLQTKLFHDSIEDALTTDVNALGGAKVVGSALRPDLTAENARAWLKACLNTDRLEKLSPGHVLEIKRRAKQVGSTATIDYEDQHLGKKSVWIDPEDEIERIERENHEMLRVILERTKRAEQLRQKGGRR